MPDDSLVVDPLTLHDVRPEVTAMAAIMATASMTKGQAPVPQCEQPEPLVG